MNNELMYLDQRRERLLQELQEVEERKQMLLVKDKEEQRRKQELTVPVMKTIREAAEEVGLSYDHIYKLCKQKRIIYVRTGKKYLVNMGHLYNYLNEGEE